jgi:hypothetical protein
MSVKYLYMLAAAGLLGCASAGSKTTAAHSGVFLGASEISETHADNMSAYEAVLRLRPNWLASHGAMTSNSQASNFAAVFVDGQFVGDVSALRAIQAYQVGDIRYYNVTEAGAKFGVRAGSTGAIEVTMKTAGQP